MKALLLVHRVWDLVTGTRIRLDLAPAAVVVAEAAHANHLPALRDAVKDALA